MTLPFSNCPECKTLVGCRIAQTCMQAAKLRAIAMPAADQAPQPTLQQALDAAAPLLAAPPVAPEPNVVLRRSVATAMASLAMPSASRKLSADICFVGGCRKQAETGTGCIGMCRELQREENEAAAQAAEARESMAPPGSSAGTAVAPPPGLEAPGRIVLCVDCKSYEKKMTQPKLLGDCINKALPLNLITGERRFPCMIARGYSQLCGTEARLWEKR